ncbi:hypothetical protein B296_00006442 [Ensete ventricosum]|uniref:Uncharacterized protein n=1 Tax=Ensete ventricosum TaxID=4639 RepID=A0A427BC48_ENSVE|nr:hypothetical protein B296_00006442 [Ensete ventricosum]
MLVKLILQPRWMWVFPTFFTCTPSVRYMNSYWRKIQIQENVVRDRFLCLKCTSVWY